MTDLYCGTQISKDASLIVVSVFFNLTSKTPKVTAIYRCIYIASIASTSPDTRAEAVLLTEKSCLVAHAFEHIL